MNSLLKGFKYIYSFFVKNQSCERQINKQTNINLMLFFLSTIHLFRSLKLNNDTKNNPDLLLLTIRDTKTMAPISVDLC